VTRYRLPYQKIHASDGGEPKFSRLVLDLTIHGINLKFLELACPLEEKNSDEFFSRGFPSEVANDPSATIQTERGTLIDNKPDRRASALTTPRAADSLDLGQKASKIVRTVFKHPAKQIEFLRHKRSRRLRFIHRSGPRFSLP